MLWNTKLSKRNRPAFSRELAQGGGIVVDDFVQNFGESRGVGVTGFAGLALGRYDQSHLFARLDLGALHHPGGDFNQAGFADFRGERSHASSVS